MLIFPILLLVALPLFVIAFFAWLFRPKPDDDSRSSFYDFLYKGLKRLIGAFLAGNNYILLLIISFPFLLMMYQHFHKPYMHWALFLIVYSAFSLLYSILVVLILALTCNQFQFNKRHLILSQRFAIICSLFCLSYYVAWAGAITMEFLNNAWAGNILDRDVMDALFALLCGILSATYSRVLKHGPSGGKGMLIFAFVFVVFSGAVVGWVAMRANYGMPIGLSLLDYFKIHPQLALDFDDVLVILINFLVGLLTQLALPALLILTFGSRVLVRKV